MSEVKPRLLDLFCGAGGAGMGYHRAGFEVVGVDIKPQPNYPFEFHQANALDFDVSGFAAIHGSPPCQHFSPITAVTGKPSDHPNLIPPTRDLLRAAGVPYVIENVPRARRALINPVSLCGVAMGMTIVEGGIRYIARRHRLFECSFDLMVPPCACHRTAGTTLGMYGGGTRQDTRKEANPGGGNTRKANAGQSRALMEMPWATRNEINQAIPPAYTEHIGRYLLMELASQTNGAPAPITREEPIQQLYSTDKKQKCRVCGQPGSKQTSLVRVNHNWRCGSACRPQRGKA